MAPRARVAAYKALWSTQDGATASGFTSDLVAAIDQAVSDGVDVINYSVSGTRRTSSIRLRFLFYSRPMRAFSFPLPQITAGLPPARFPTRPWLTTVAAGTHNRNVSGSVTLGNGVTYFRCVQRVGGRPGSVVLATASGLPGADPNLLRQCFSSPAVLDPTKVTGKIVVCERGGALANNARVDKSLAVKNAGGVGMILYNVAAGATLNADFPPSRRFTSTMSTVPPSPM
jgi:hypothetical protein